MGRSVKKGPFVDAKLLSRIVAMNEKNEKVIDKREVVAYNSHKRKTCDREE